MRTQGKEAIPVEIARVVRADRIGRIPWLFGAQRRHGDLPNPAAEPLPHAAIVDVQGIVGADGVDLGPAVGVQPGADLQGGGPSRT